MSPSDLDDLEAILRRTLAEAAPWVEANCGRAELDRKDAAGVEATAIHEAVTEVDRGLQDRILEPVLERFPDLVPLAEERTPLAELHRHRRGFTALLLDPIDGTQSYARGRHDYATMAAIAEGGRIIFGCVARFHPLQISCARLLERPEPAQGPCPDRLRVICHYRLFSPAFCDVVKRLEAGGCELAAVPVDLNSSTGPDDSHNGPGLGSNGAAMLALIAGRWDAYLAPHVTLHDIAGPWSLAVSQGATAIRFLKANPELPDDWMPMGDRFDVPESPRDYPVRARVLIARNSTIAGRLLEIL